VWIHEDANIITVQVWIHVDVILNGSLSLLILK